MFTSPEKNVAEFGFMPGQSVADFGSGAGHYALALSRTLGSTGRVYAIDIQEGLLSRLLQQEESEGRSNIKIIWGDIEKPKGTLLQENTVDGAVFSNILFQLQSKEEAIREAYRILKPGGRVCVVEWADLDLIRGVKREKVGDAVTKESATALFTAAGFAFEKTFDAGDHHYGVLFKK